MIGSGELIVILCVILVLFGGKKLPEFARNLGRGVKEFKKACQGIEDEFDETEIIENTQESKIAQLPSKELEEK